MSKVLQLAADSVALDSLRSMLSNRRGNQQAAEAESSRRAKERRKSGKTFKLTNEILKMPENYRRQSMARHQEADRQAVHL